MTKAPPATAARNADAKPADTDADEPEIAAAEAAGEIAGSADHAGMGRGDQPRHAKSKTHDRN